MTDAIGLIALFGVNSAMILFGLVMERANAGRASIDWRPFIHGCIAGAVPWVAIGVQLGVSQANNRGVPGFVFAIFLTLFMLFNTFAVKHVASVPGTRTLGGPGVRRARVSDPQPRREECPRLAGLRRRARRKLSSSTTGNAPPRSHPAAVDQARS